MQRNFQLDVTLPGKAVEADDGDIIIEGYASDFGRDRENEFFTPNAFEKAIDAYMSTNPTLHLHHSPERQLGQVEKLELREDGLWLRARVVKGHVDWHKDAYEKIKRGIMRGLSVGGAMRKRHDGMIDGIDLREISVTPLPVNPRTMFAVAQKAFADEEKPPEPSTEQAAEIRAWFQNQIELLETKLDDLEGKAHGGTPKLTDKPWDGSSSRFTIAQWRRSTLIERGGDRDSKANFGLPVREPDGTVNCRGVANARARINQVQGATAESKARAQRILNRLQNACERHRGTEGD